MSPLGACSNPSDPATTEAKHRETSMILNDFQIVTRVEKKNWIEIQ
jgi:hypothetical protein